MAIARYENITVQNVVNNIDSFGQYTTTLTTFFNTRARVMDVHSRLHIAKEERVYNDLVKFVLNYTPNTRQMSDNQNLYAIQYRNEEWRITDAIESNDRMNITFLCYRNKPTAPV